MDKYDSSLAPRFSQLLVQREAELRAILRATGGLAQEASGAEPREVTDFKDVAEEETQAAVDEATADHAAEELEQIAAARRRLADASYGYCLACGEAINLRRLLALPAAPLCTACQTAREHERTPHLRG